MPNFALIIMFSHVKIACYQSGQGEVVTAAAGVAVACRRAAAATAVSLLPRSSSSCHSSRRTLLFSNDGYGLLGGVVPSPLIEPRWAERGKGPLKAHDPKA